MGVVGRWLQSRVHHNVTHNSQDMETVQVFIHRCVGKDAAGDKGCTRTHACTHASSIHKKGGNADVCNNLNDPEHITGSEISQTQEKKYYIICLLCGV